VADLSTGELISGTQANGTITGVGGGWYRVSVTGALISGDAGVSAFVYLYNGTSAAYDGDGVSGIYAWGMQLEFNSAATTYQRVTSATDYADVGAPRKIDFDGVDDKLTTTFPDLGSNVTIVRSVPGVGASILTGQTIGAGAWDDSTDHCGLIIINRALTAPETALVTRWANLRAGV